MNTILDLNAFLQVPIQTHNSYTGELKHIFSLFPNIEKTRVLFTPNFAPKEEYIYALHLGVYVTVDNIHPLRNWPEVFKGRDIILRIDPGKGEGHHTCLCYYFFFTYFFI